MLPGQLGLGEKDFSLGPRKVETFASFVRISSGYAHNVCISTTKKYLNAKIAEEGIGETDVFHDRVDMTPVRPPNTYLKLFHCCRRLENVSSDKRVFACNTCKLDAVCLLCVRVCHHRHNISLRVSADGSTEKHYCTCGVRKNCHILPPIPETWKEIESTRTNEVETVTEVQRFSSELKLQHAARIIQKCCKKYTDEVFRGRAQYMANQIRYEVCEQYWERDVLGTIWTKLHFAFGKYLEVTEQRNMAIEEKSRRLYDHYARLQSALQGMDCILDGVRTLFSRACIMRITLKKNTAGRPVVKRKSTYTMTWHGLKNLMLSAPTEARLAYDEFALISQEFPRYKKREGLYFDIDISLLTSRYLRDTNTMIWRDELIRRKVLAEVAAETKRLANAPRYTGSRAKLALKQASLAQSIATRTNALQRELRRDSEDEEEVNNNNTTSRQLKRQLSGSSTRSNSVPNISTKSTTSTPKIKMSTPLPLRRRHSIGDPSKLYSRVCGLRSNLLVRNFFERRNSLPINLKVMRPKQRPTWTFYESIRNSLDLFTNRVQIMYDFIDPEYEYVWFGIPEEEKRMRLKKALAFSWCTPKLPREMMQKIREPSRRRTISEPERYGSLMKLQLETRKAFETLRKVGRKDYRLLLRQRSYDPTEILDGEDGVTKSIGMEYEEPLALQTKDELFLDLLKMEKLLVSSGWHTLLRKFDDNSQSKGTESPSGKTGKRRRVPPPPPPGDPPPEEELWQENQSEDGKVYYYNPLTGESSWVVPHGGNVQILRGYQDAQSGAWYWRNETTGETSWM